MKILVSAHKQDKTNRLIQMSANGEGTIVTPIQKNVERIKTQAKEMELDIPEPITWVDFLFHGKSLDAKGPFLLDDVGLLLSSLGVTTATVDKKYVQTFFSQEGNASDWIENEIKVAIESEKAASSSVEEYKMGVDCYNTALQALRMIARNGHSSFETQVIISIMNRLVGGRPLTPIEDTEDIWNEVSGQESPKIYQCKRMSSLFKEIAVDHTVTYSDINRVNIVDINNFKTSHDGFATHLVDKIFPIEMPYLPSKTKFKVIQEKLQVGDKGKDGEIIAYLYVITPDGKTVDLNLYFKKEHDKMVKIEKDEFEERKARKVKKK